MNINAKGARVINLSIPHYFNTQSYNIKQDQQ